MTNPIEDVLKARVILITGTNTTVNHPIIANFVHEAVTKNGAKLIVVDPRKIKLVDISHLWLRQRVGTDVAWINGFMNIIINENLQAQTYIDERTTGYEEVKQCVAKYTPDYVSGITGIPANDLMVWGDIYEQMEYTNGEIVVVGWPWVEMDRGALSGEASMLVNPGGTFMYAVWNQWEEDIYVDEYGSEHEIVLNSDMPFRRFMYLPDDSPIDSVPVATILSAPDFALQGEAVTLIGSGYDADDPDGENNITTYQWSSSLDGVLSTGTEQIYTTNTLSAGMHIITLVVVDDEGLRSNPGPALPRRKGRWRWPP